jgi:two-component system, NarL family, sensor histidine kinase DesK
MATDPPADRRELALSVEAPGGRRRGLKLPFVAAALFFYLAPLASLLANPPAPAALALLLVGWAIFGAVLVLLLRRSPFVRERSGRWLAVAVVAIAAIALVAQVAFGVDEAAALYFYAGVTAGRLVPERWALGGIGGVTLAAVAGTSLASGDVAAGVTTGVTVGTICLTLFALAAMGRSNRELQAARTELATLAVAEERSRIARDLHDSLGHSLSVIALKSELARRVLPDDPTRAAAEIGDVEQAARDALAAVRETVSGYRVPSLAVELAGARAALLAAGIEGVVEPAPHGLPRDVDAVLGWAVREGVTNVLRHSDATSAAVRVLADGPRRSVEVVDDGMGLHAGDARDQRPGTGIDGLRERARGLGGAVEAGPLPERGFRLLVTVPLPEAPSP